MKSFKVCLKSLYGRYRPLRPKVLVSVLLGLGSVAASLSFVWVSKKVVDIATHASDGPLKSWVIAFVGIMAVQIVLRVAQQYWEGYIVVSAQNDARAATFSKVMRSVWNGREKFHSGDTINRLEGDVSTVTDFLCVNLPDCLSTLVQLVAATVFLFVMQPKLGWTVIFIMPVAVLGSRLFFKKMRRLSGEIRAGDSKVQGHMQENLQHRVLIRTLLGTGKVMEKLGQLQDDVRVKTVSRLNYNAMARGFMNLGFSAGYAAAFLWGVFGLRDNTVTYGMMVAFLQLVGQVQRPVADIARHIPAFIKALSSEERLMELVEQDVEDEGTPVIIPSAPGVRLDDISYTYPEKGEPVLDHFSFDFKPGEMTLIVGPTGSGKSTLVKVIMALLKPDSGAVTLYDGTGEWPSCVDTRCNFMYVPQGNSLMSGTIRENLLLADPDATDEKIREALHLAAADFVFELPDGLETSCAEVGAGLSEGQAQRVAVARALLRPGGIMILDEATSALDADTEQELLTRLNRHFHGSKTILCITHRPAATSFADATCLVVKS